MRAKPAAAAIDCGVGAPSRQAGRTLKKHEAADAAAPERQI
jgi:hypothetical protein